LLLTVGRIGRAHGVRGEVTVEVRTDSPENRFYPGAILSTDPEARGPLKVSSVRWNNATLLLAFEGRIDRNQVEDLRDTVLLAEVDVNEEMEEDEFHIAQIVGCIAIDEDGSQIGEVIDVLPLPGADTLVIARAGSEILIPFVKHHVPEIEVAKKQITVANLDGLL